MGGEPVGIVRRGETAFAVAAQAGFLLGVPVEPVGQAFCHDVGLREDPDLARYHSADDGQ